MINIEQAVLADMDSILQIEQVCFGADAFTRRQFSYLIQKAKGSFYVAKREDRIVGYLSFITNSYLRYGRIYSIAVHPEARRMNIAGLLLERAADYTRSLQLKTMTLEVNVNNDAAIRLYRKHGFSLKGTKPCYYPDGSDAFCMYLGARE